MEETTAQHDIHKLGWGIIDFCIRNIFGILCFLSGFTYQIYEMSGKKKELRIGQRVISILFWAISGGAIVIGLSGLHMNKLLYGFVCWATPIVIKPFADKVAEHSPNLGEKLMVLIEFFVDRKKKDLEK